MSSRLPRVYATPLFSRVCRSVVLSVKHPRYRRPIYKPAAADLNEYEEYEYYTDDEDMGVSRVVVSIFSPSDARC